VYRLSPGRTLVFDTETNRIERVNHQEHFQSISDTHNADKLAEQIWGAFAQACKRIGKGSQPIGVMLSGGLDSRMVIAGMQASGINAIACTHGQEGFHEVSASRKVAQLAGVKHHLIPMENDSYIGACEELERVFWTTDTTLFPVWRLGGNLLKERGAKAFTSGYCLDATLGGHFHDVENPRLRFVRRLKHAIREPRPKEGQDLFRQSYLQAQIERIQLRAKTAFQNQENIFRPEFYNHLRSLLTTLTDDLSGEIERIRQTGTQNPAKVWERFLCENHARKFSFSQELVARSYLPMVIPSYDRALISLLTSMNPVLTLDHCLYFKIMRRFAREFAGVSWSSTAMPITYPIIVNELSRAGRNRYDQWAKRKFIRSDGKTLRSRYGAMDYEVVARQTGNLESLQAILNSNGSSRILNGNQIQKRIDEIRTYKRKAFNMIELTNLVTIRFAETLN
jgi:asparagine synthetase B (glutamine-hydrolysing)